MLLLYNLEELDVVAERILAQAKSKTILFYGEMGAGKTTLIKSLIKKLGAEDDGSSPTFSLVNEYESRNGNIYHFDFYRIKDRSEALDMGIEEYLNSGAWNFIEWPQQIVSLLPDGSEIVEIEIMTKNRRKLKFS